MNIRRHACFLAMLGLAAPMTLGSPAEVAAQTVFTQQQIIHQLRRPRVQAVPGQQGVVAQPRGKARIVRRRAPQVDPRLLHRAPRQGVARMRVPEPVDPNGRVGVRRAPGSAGVAKFRAPPPRNGGTARFRAPSPQQGGTAEFRAPPPQGGTQRFRAPPANHARPPSSGQVEVASASDRGLEIRPAAETQIATGTNYPGNGRIDLEILFDYDSDRIDPGSLKQLVILGEALNDESLADARIVVAGHTDAAGSDAYNADLSLRRARAVYEFLVDYSGVDANRLVPEGYGESLLKFPDAPHSGQNRRVEIINLDDAG
ncbi:MAG: OmpA family protein [Pseudomonadota bacterium]|nr:OmpA family protein [Pseudomonadota bacterium]